MELGKHYLVEFIGCGSAIIDQQEALRAKMLQAVAMSEANIITDIFHKFSPQGVTGVVVIAESHVAIHTWPEHQYAAVDIFTCTDKMKVDLLIDILQKSFEAESVSVRQVSRGFLKMAISV